MDYATAALGAAKAIHDLVERNLNNRRNLAELTNYLIDDIQRLNDLRQRQSKDFLPDLDRDLATLQNDLRQLVLDCEKIFRKKPGVSETVRHFARTRLWGVGQIEDRIMSIRKNAKDAHLQFLEHNSVGARVEMHTLFQTQAVFIQEQITELKASFGSSISTARQEVAQASSLSDIATLTPGERRKEYDEAVRALESADITSAERRMLRLKVKTFESALTGNPLFLGAERTALPPGYEFPGSQYFYPMVKNKDVTRAYAVQETYSLISAMTDPECHVPASEWVGRANSLVLMLRGPLGLHLEALKLAQICFTVSKQIASMHPADFQPDLALILYNLSVSFHENGQFQEAMEAAQSDVEIGEQLAEQDPEAYNNGLAQSLNRLSISISDLGKHGNALEIAQRSIQICDPLYQRDPVAYGPDLARSLNILSTILTRLHNYEEALQSAQKAVEIYNQLIGNVAEVCRPGLADALDTLSDCLSGLGQREKAFQESQEAWNIYNQLLEQGHDAFQLEFAQISDSLSSRLSEGGYIEDALEHKRSAVGIYKGLLEDESDLCMPQIYLGISVSGWGRILKKAGRSEEAVPLLKEGLKVMQEYADRCPGIVEKELDACKKCITEI